jgi:hypothetical protein
MALKTDAKTTWALVVGIDKYRGKTIRELKGASLDAWASVRWLQALGVPHEQILLHACAVSDENKAKLAELAPPVLEASEPKIWESIARLKQQKGTCLFVFLSGHGLFEHTTGPAFLTQEAREGDWVNLGLVEYIKLFRSFDFTRQFLLMDGCLNHPYDSSKRPKFSATMHAGAQNTYSPSSKTTLWSCLAAAQGEVAFETETPDGARGLMSYYLLNAVDPERPRPGVQEIDDQTGDIGVSLNRAIKVIRSQVENVSAQRGQTQHPGIFTSSGSNLGDEDAILYRMAPPATGKIRVLVEPTAAAPYLQSIRVACIDYYWERQLPFPPGAELSLPTELQLPLKTTIEPSCVPQLDAPWEFEPAGRIKLDTNTLDVPLRLHELIPPPPPDYGTGSGTGDTGEADEDTDRETTGFPGQFSGVKDSSAGVGPQALPNELWQGFEALGYPGSNAFLVGAIGESYKLTMDAVTETPLQTAYSVLADQDNIGLNVLHGRLVVFGRQTTWPDLRTAANRIARAISGATPPGVVAVAVQAATSHQSFLAMPVSGNDLASLAGNHIFDPCLYLRDECYPLAALAVSPLGLPVDPGIVSVTLELPWGSWHQVLPVSPGRTATLTLPETVGRPPLRVRFADRLARSPGAAPTSRKLRRVIVFAGITSVQIHEVDAPVAVYMTHQVSVRRPRKPRTRSTGQFLYRSPGRVTAVTAAGRLVAPLPPSAVADLHIAAEDPVPRAELALPDPSWAWDSVVVQGRLDGVSMEQAAALQGEGTGIGAAAAGYLFYGQEDWKALADALHADSPGWSAMPLDLALLTLAARKQLAEFGQEITTGQVMRIVADAAVQLAVPSFRWGIPLARAVAKPGDTTMATWAAHLNRVEGQLVPTSGWTLWLDFPHVRGR